MACDVDVIRHEMAYRAIPHVDYVAQNGLVQGGWGVPTSVPVMSSPNYLFDANGMFSLPPQQFLLNAEELHSEILEFVHTASPSAEARSCAEGAIDCVRDAVKRLWPSADVEVHSSFRANLLGILVLTVCSQVLICKSDINTYCVHVAGVRFVCHWAVPIPQ